MYVCVRCGVLCACVRAAVCVLCVLCVCAVCVLCGVCCVLCVCVCVCVYLIEHAVDLQEGRPVVGVRLPRQAQQVGDARQARVRDARA